MPVNVNVALSDKTYQILQKIKEEGRLRTNADAITAALINFVQSEEFQRLKGGRLTEGVAPPSTNQIIRIVREFSEHHTKELAKVKERVEKLEKERGG